MTIYWICDGLKPFQTFASSSSTIVKTCSFHSTVHWQPTQRAGGGGGGGGLVDTWETRFSISEFCNMLIVGSNLLYSQYV